MIGTLNVLLAARDSGVQRVVCASSSSVYGANETLPKAEHLPAEPISRTPSASWRARLLPQLLGGLRPRHLSRSATSTSSGRGSDLLSQYSAVVPTFIDALLDGERPVIYGDGSQTRDFTYIDNVIEGTVLALTAPEVAGKVYNIAYGEGVTVNALFELLREIVGADVEPRYVEARAGEVRHSQADISRATKELGYRPSISLREGLSLTVEYYRGRRSESPVPL